MEDKNDNHTAEHLGNTRNYAELLTSTLSGKPLNKSTKAIITVIAID